MATQVAAASAAAPATVQSQPQQAIPQSAPLQMPSKPPLASVSDWRLVFTSLNKVCPSPDSGAAPASLWDCNWSIHSRKRVSAVGLVRMLRYNNACASIGITYVQSTCCKLANFQNVIGDDVEHHLKLIWNDKGSCSTFLSLSLSLCTAAWRKTIYLRAHLQSGGMLLTGLLCLLMNLSWVLNALSDGLWLSSNPLSIGLMHLPCWNMQISHRWSSAMRIGKCLRLLSDCLYSIKFLHLAWRAYSILGFGQAFKHWLDPAD